MREPGPCPVCGASLDIRQRGSREAVYFQCPRCGPFGLTDHTEFALADLLNTPRKRAVLSYAMRTTPPSGRDTPLFSLLDCRRIIEADFLPTPQEQGENLIRWLGDNLPGAGHQVRIAFQDLGATLGSQSGEGFHFVVQGLIDAGLLHGVQAMGATATVTLTFSGWTRYEALRRGAPSGRKAFMAMEYEDALLDRIVNEHFRPAVQATGFVLRRLDDEPRAGLIDDRLRVEIQSSRFLIVDLTHRNAGAYWEAGYAEGLGKPVIFTCRASKFQEASHFDTNHHFHVLWDETALDAAVAMLKASIRATIPEAKRD